MRRKFLLCLTCKAWRSHVLTADKKFYKCPTCPTKVPVVEAK